MTEGICTDQKAGQRAITDPNNITYTLIRRGEYLDLRKIGISTVDLLESTHRTIDSVTFWSYHHFSTLSALI